MPRLEVVSTCTSNRRPDAEPVARRVQLAAFAAMRDVETGLRELAKAGPRDVGALLMKYSRAEAGPPTGTLSSGTFVTPGSG